MASHRQNPSTNQAQIMQWNDGGSSRALMRDDVFMRNFTGQVSLANGDIEGVYTVHKPTNSIVNYYFLLDTSGSMGKKTEAGIRVSKLLFRNFKALVMTLKDNDLISVWAFNSKVTLLRKQVTKQVFLQEFEDITAQYESLLKARRTTKLYEAMKKVADQVKDDWEHNKNADFFLVSFTDGIDKGEDQKTACDEMMWKIGAISGRIHTVFITANLPEESILSVCLKEQNEMRLIKCENTNEDQIRAAFKELQQLIKAILRMTLTARTGDNTRQFRDSVYGATMKDVNKKMGHTVRNRYGTGAEFISAFNELSLKG